MKKAKRKAIKAKTKTSMNALIEDMKKQNIILGSKVTLKEAEKGNIIRVYLSNDCADFIEKAIIIVAAKKKSNINVIKLTLTKEELKELCKKPFNISAISVLKGKEKGEKKAEVKAKPEEKAVKPLEIKKKKKKRTKKKEKIEKEEKPEKEIKIEAIKRTKEKQSKKTVKKPTKVKEKTAKTKKQDKKTK